MLTLTNIGQGACVDATWLTSIIN